MVPGYENEPYLRFLVNGRVEVNDNSPAKYLNEERYGGVTVPGQRQRQGEAELELDRPRRHLHLARAPGALDVDEAAAEGEKSDGNKLEKVFDWVVPLSVGGDRVKASGTLWWVPSAQLERRTR